MRMLFDYPEREIAYCRIKAQVEHHGYQARLLGLGGCSDGLVLAVHTLSDHSRSFVVHKRERGWFLRLLEPVYYSIPNAEAVLPICLELLTHLESSIEPDLQALTHQLGVEYDLVAIPSEEWVQDDWRELESNWKQHGWIPTEPENEKAIWASFLGWYRQQVLLVEGKVLGHSHSQVWDLTQLDFISEEVAKDLEADLTLKFLAALRRHNHTSLPLYALDRHHPSYLFEPRLAKPIATRNYWAIPFLPLDNDCFFIAQDYSFGILGLYLPKCILIFGRELLNAVQADVPELLLKVGQTKK